MRFVHSIIGASGSNCFVADLASNGNLFGLPQGPDSGVIYQLQVVPEPSALLLAGIGVLGMGLAALARRHKRS